MNTGIDKHYNSDNHVFQEVKDDLLDIRSKICHSFLIAFSILIIPALSASLYRATTIGWQPVMTVHILIAVILWVFLLYKERIPYRFKAGYIILIFLIIGLGALFQFGLISGGVIFVITSVPLAALLFGVRSAALTLTLVLLGIAGIGFATVSGYIGPDFDLQIYNSATSSWIATIFGSFLVAGALTTSISVFNKKLITSVQVSRQREKELQMHQANLEKTIEEKTKKLKLSNQELERFAQIAAHDINSPLASISGHAQLLRALYHGKLDDKADSYLDEMIKSTEYVCSVIKDQLNYSRLDKDILLIGQVDMNEAHKQAEVQLTKLIEKSSTKISHDPLPMVRGIQVQIVRVLQNILSNAMKYRDDNRGLIIHTTSRLSGGFWDFSISDNGVGIEADQLNKVFEMYHQSNSESDIEGAGIGLSTCKKIIESQGGEIWVESEFGKGSTFHFSLKSVDNKIENEMVNNTH